MTDAQIIKMLESNSIYSCEECCDYTTAWCEGDGCNVRIAKYALELIRRQQAELKNEKAKKEIAAECIARQDKMIEELKEYANKKFDDFASEYDNAIKAEAIKEFAEKLKKRTSVIGFHATSEDYMDGYFAAINYYDAKINNLLKEMAGENNEN